MNLTNYNEIRALTSEAMKKQIVYIPDDEDYEAVWELAKLSSGHIPETRLRKRLEANREAVEKLGRLREEAPERARTFFEKAVAFARDRREAGVSLHTVHTRRPLLSALWYTLRTLFLLPFALVLGTASLPAWGVAEWMASRVKDPAFRNSFRCVVLLLLWTLLLLAWAIVLLCTVKWYWAIAAVVLLIPAPMLTYDYFELVRRTASSWRYLFNGRLRRQKEQLINELRELNI